MSDSGHRGERSGSTEYNKNSWGFIANEYSDEVNEQKTTKRRHQEWGILAKPNYQDSVEGKVGGEFSLN